LTVEVLEDRTVPSFLPPVSYPGGGGDMAVADFNNDRIPDLVVLNPTANTISVRLGNGDGTFGAAKTAAAGTGPVHLVTGDFNGDGKLDVVLTNHNGLTTLLGNGDGTFRPPLNQAGPQSQVLDHLAAGDFNGDGKLDLAVTGSKYFKDGGSPAYLDVLLGKGDGTFHTKSTTAIGDAPNFVAVGDFNGDAKLDILAGTSFGNSLLLGKGDGSFQTPISPNNVGLLLAVGDVNGDGKLDTVGWQWAYDGGAHHNVVVGLGNGDGTFPTIQTFSVGDSYPVAAALADFNGDGKRDLVMSIAPDNTVSVLRGNGDGTFGATTTIAAGSTAAALAVGDFNGDGRPDLALTMSDAVWVLLNDGHW
jgi:hypothetical protein